MGGVDLAMWLVRGGHALDWPKYSKGKCDGVQREAEHAARGMWAGSYVAEAEAAAEVAPHV
jgi:endonuclease YncB( thermonuclease family)